MQVQQEERKKQKKRVQEQKQEEEEEKVKGKERAQAHNLQVKAQPFQIGVSMKSPKEVSHTFLLDATTPARPKHTHTKQKQKMSKCVK